MQVIALDIGGSSVKSGMVDIAGDGAALITALEPVQLPTREFSDLEQVVYAIVGRARERFPDANGVGISTTGSVDRHGTVVSAGHFSGYVNVAWEVLLTRRFAGLESVVTLNDGRAAAWAEYAGGAGDATSHVHAVVGTGVGGGIVHEGRLLLGDSGQAGYIGHIKVTGDETLMCSCGRQGCVEAVAAAPAIVAYYNEAAGRHDDAASVDEVTQRAREGDADAVDAFSRAGWWLGRGLGNAMNVLNPSVVTVGGGVLLASESIAGEGDGGPFFHAIAAGMEGAAHKRVLASADLKMAVHGNDGGMIGAALLSRDALNGSG